MNGEGETGELGVRVAVATARSLFQFQVRQYTYGGRVAGPSIFT